MKTIALTLALLGALPLARAQSEAPDSAPELAQKAALDQANQSQERTLQDANRVADEAMHQAHQAVQLAKSQVAMADADEMGRDMIELKTAFDAWGPPGRSGGAPLIVRAGDIDAKALGNIQEDMSVMSRILDKAVEREVGKDAHDSAMGIAISTLPGGRRPQSIYLEGYGALFLLNVRFPLVPAPSKDQEKNEKATDTTWEQTKRELYSGSDRVGTVRILGDIPVSQREAEYDADQVESVKKALIESLKNASNIREVKPDESVTVVVMGTRAGAPAVRAKRVYRKNTLTTEDLIGVNDSARSRRDSNMTVRAKKADIDAFAKGELDLEQFKKRVSVAVY